MCHCTFILRAPIKSYSILFLLGYVWHPSTAGIPPNAIESGFDVDGSRIYVGRATHESEVLPANIIPSEQVAYVCHNGQVISKHHYEVTDKPFHLRHE